MAGYELTGRGGLSRAQQRERKALSKAVADGSKHLTRRTGWRISQGWIFKEHTGWFMEVRGIVRLHDLRTIVEWRAKPMALDPVFWDIVGLPENREQPLSFRLFGAWTCKVPTVVEAEIPEGGGQTEGIAQAILAWADRQFIATELSRCLDAFVEFLRGHPRRGAYLASYISALILMHRYDEALTECAVAMERNEVGGFGVGRLTSPVLAKSWLTSVEQGRALH